MEFVVTTKQQLSDLITEAIGNAISNRNETPEKKVEIIDRNQLCKRLNITEQSIIRWEKKGKIPRIEIGSSVRYNWFDVLEALQAKKKHST